MAGVSFYNLPAVSTSLFSPADLQNLEAWYKSDAGITTVSGEVSVWADQSGNNRDLTHSIISSRPLYGSEILNGIDVLTFSGNDFLLSASTSSHNFLHQNNSTVFILAKTGIISNPNQQYYYLASNTTSATTGYSIHYDDRVSASRNNSFVLTLYRGVSGSSVIFSINNNKITPNIWSRITAATDVDASSADRFDGYVDFVKFDGINSSADTISVANATYQLNIGRFPTSTGYFIGDIAEIIMYSRNLTLSEITQVDDYLKLKYAL